MSPLTALWRLLNPAAGEFCRDKAPRGFDIGRCVLSPGHDGAHQDHDGSTWVRVYVAMDDEEGS